MVRARARRQSQWKGKNYSPSFPEEAEKKLRVLLCTQFSIPTYYNSFGYKNHPSACMSYCSDDLAQWFLCLDFQILEPENISVREQIFASFAECLSMMKIIVQLYISISI